MTLSRVAITSLAAVASAATLLCATGSAADVSDVACGPDRPIVRTGERVVLEAWVAPGQGPAEFEWTDDAGVAIGSGPQVSWTPGKAGEEGRIATVRVRTRGHRRMECRLSVFVVPEEELKGGRPTHRALLTAGTAEAAGYGLYSYLLFGSPPSAAQHARYLGMVQAALDLIVAIEARDQRFPPGPDGRQDTSFLNLISIPVRSAPTDGVSATWVLDNYDFRHAQRLLGAVPGITTEGPYFVSVRIPLGLTTGMASPCLLLDFTQLPTRVAPAAVRLFLNQTAQELNWHTLGLRNLGLRTRLALAVLVEGKGKVEDALPKGVRLDPVRLVRFFGFGAK